MWDTPDPRSNDARDRDPANRPHAVATDPRDVLTRDLDLPRGPDRERVHGRDRDYDLRGSEVRTLATIGAFRVVPIDDLADTRNATDLSHGDLARLRSTGLIEVVAPLDRAADTTTVVTLTKRGHELLERHQRDDGRVGQRFYAGIVKSRELSHDAQLVRAYLRSAARLQRNGMHIARVVLDHELKRDYQRFLQDRNRHRPNSDGRPTRTREEVDEWARAHHLPVHNGHVQFPDVRIEYESPDGRRDSEDIEVTTRHYRGTHAAAKARSGFSRFRARGRRVGGASGRRGGRPSPSHVAEEFLE